MRKLYGLLACLAVFLGAFLVNAPAASAATGVISNGIAWSPNTVTPPTAGLDKPLGDYCTMTAVGTDVHGNKLAISAGHCVGLQDTNAVNYKPDGAPVYRWVPNNGYRDQIGTIAYRGDVDRDFVVIKLNDDAILSSTGPGARIDGVGATNPFGVMCKDGQSTGVTCGLITGQNAFRLNNLALGFNGDSGGPAWVAAGKLVGLVRGPGEYVKYAPVHDAILTHLSPIGDGFAITNN